MPYFLTFKKMSFSFMRFQLARCAIFKNSNKLRQSLDNVYNNALLKEEALKMQDLKNQLYVAFTRAKTTMYIFKLTQKSAFEILNLNATTWGDCAIPFAKNIMTDKKADFCKILEHKYSLENLGRQREIYTQEQDEKEVLEADLGVRYSLQSTYYGIALHFAMEQKLKQQINDSILLEILHNKFGFYLELRSLEKILHRANLLLKNENFIEIVAKGKVKCEIPFLSNGKQKRLDLLILGKNEAWIVESSTIMDSDVGPLAHLRPNSIVRNSHIGNFVETKNSELNGVKVGHLSYLGDSEVGSGTNIGAGFITCNYDGRAKYKTKIGKNVFIGSDSQAIAPITIEDDCLVGAGSTIRRNLKKGEFFITCGKEVIKEGFFYKFFNKKA